MAFAAQLRQALRGFQKSPGFTATALLTLALGIGANVAIFSALDAVLFRPLPYREPERLVALYEALPTRSEPRMPLSMPAFLEWRDRARSFESMAAYRLQYLVLTGRGEPERIRAGMTTAGLFEALGVAPSQGRSFSQDDETPGRTEVVVLSHLYWTRRLASDPAAVGSALVLNGRPHTIVGILPEGFAFTIHGAVPDVFVPQPRTGPSISLGSHNDSALARLKPGVTLAAADQEVKALAAGLAQAHPDSNQGFSAAAYDLHDELVGRDTRRTLYLLMGAVGLLLLIACVNVANLLLARALVRERETAIRVALGAGRGDLFRKFLAEGLLLGLGGAALGLALAALSLGGLRALLPPSEVLTQTGGALRLDATALALTLGLALGTAVFFGLAPLAQLRDRHLDHVLREGGRSGTGRGGGLRRALVVSEVALCAFLLLGAGLMLRSLLRLQGARLGFEPRNAYAFTVTLRGLHRYDADGDALAFHQRLLERLRAQPGVLDAGAAWVMPLQGRTSRTAVQPLDRPRTPEALRPVENANIISSGYLRAMGIPVVRGRGFLETDTSASPRAILVNETFAARYWPGRDPVGQRLEVGLDGEHPPADPSWEVVGVVGDTRLHDMGKDPEGEFYLPMTQLPPDGMTYVVRTSGAPEAMAAAARAQVRALDGDLAVLQGQPLARYVRDHLERHRTVLALLGIFSALALALAGVGLYGIVAFQVAQRSRELAIRIALGAELRQIVRLVLGQGARLVGLGLAAGLLGALAFGRVLQGLLYGVTPSDPPTYLAVALLLGAVALAASLVPALRAARVDPTEALRAD